MSVAHARQEQCFRRRFILTDTRLGQHGSQQTGGQLKVHSWAAVAHESSLCNFRVKY